MIHKFSNWGYEANWYSYPRKRFPYLGNPAKGRALLTTASFESFWEYGTIVSNASRRDPAPWMNLKNVASPGSIWYWLNENDCNIDYAKGLLILALIISKQRLLKKTSGVELNF